MKNRGLLAGLIFGGIALFVLTAGDYLKTGIEYDFMDGAGRSASSSPGLLAIDYEVGDGDTLYDTLIFSGGELLPFREDSVAFLTPNYDSTWITDSTITIDTTYIEASVGVRLDTVIDRYTGDTTFIGPDTTSVIEADTIITADTTANYDTLTIWTDTTWAIDTTSYSVRAFTWHGPMLGAQFDAPLWLTYVDRMGHRDTIPVPFEIYNSTSGFPLPAALWIPVQIDTAFIAVFDSLAPMQLFFRVD